MALNYQTSTLSMTLPISCQICLGKVKQPVICGNHHVFCSSCMEMWLKKASQCPTCRVPITAESPCREIIGGTNESDHSESPSMRKCLRKTRGELLLREYEGDIEGFIRENEELRTKNQSLEAQLKTALDPCSINAGQTGDMSVDPSVLEELKNRLRAATDVCDKVKQDMDKLKEANKALRSQNVDLVQENMRLKAEVVSRSPQKFGRCTVAALEAKIQLYERDMDHLKRALERSDQYIEDLESRVTNSEKRSPEGREVCGGSSSSSSKAGSEALTREQKISMMMRSLSDSERASICSNPETECRTISRNHGLGFVASADHKEFNKNLVADKKSEDLESSSSDLLPTTPSSAFRSLTLRSPGIREKRVAFKPGSFLRRLDFEDFPNLGKTNIAIENQFNILEKFTKDLPPMADSEPSKSDFWGDWPRASSIDPPCPGPSKENPIQESTSVDLEDDEPDSFQMSSEASMDAAYLDKISELDSMMLDGESSSSRGSQLSLAPSPAADLDNTIIPEPQTCPGAMSTHKGNDQMNHQTCDDTDGTLFDKAAPKGDAEEGCAAQVSCRESQVHVSDCVADEGLSQTEELSFDLLFDSLEDNKAGTSGSLSPAGKDHDHLSPSSSFSCNGKPVNTRDRHTLIISQPTKRKSHSPFSSSSPTKLSKLM